MYSRRDFMKILTRLGLASASAPLWSNMTSLHAMAQSGGDFRAIVIITLTGGNDGNNILIPLDTARYQQYASLRPSIAIPRGSIIPLTSANGSSDQYGLHPSLRNLAAYYNSQRALVVANVGPKEIPGGYSALLQSGGLPEGLFSHPASVNQWESASNMALPDTGWGGRMADLLTSQSGSLPPLLDAANSSIFTVGRTIQAIAIRPSQARATAVSLPSGLSDAALALAQIDSRSSNLLVAQAGQLRVNTMKDQVLLDQAQSSGITLQTIFPSNLIGRQLQTIADVIKGRSVIGANRQIFYAEQGPYDTHANQNDQHGKLLTDLDTSIAAFMSALQELGLSDKVLVCTLSDFNRTMTTNSNGGTDHGWGNHQFVIGGGIKGGRILGTYPDLDLGGSMDTGTTGVWIPSLSVTEMTAGVGAWMGLSTPQLKDVFPQLPKFTAGPLNFG